MLIENVHGITVDFRDKRSTNRTKNYAEILIDELSRHYHVFWRMIDASDYGVPQGRVRFILIGLRKEAINSPVDPFEALVENRAAFLRKRGLLSSVGAATAISDLEEQRNGRTASNDSPGYEAIAYKHPRTNYQRLMRDGYSAPPSNTRLAKHRPDIAKRFSQIIAMCNENGRLNVSIGRELREKFGLKKQALRVLDPDSPAPTITSMPDDLLHYREPRTLTVRENARLQSFPDWFDFRGKYTTGGHLRRKEVPRFTQVANAVPPLLAEAIGITISEWIYSASDFISTKRTIAKAA